VCYTSPQSRSSIRCPIALCTNQTVQYAYTWIDGAEYVPERNEVG
jgi:hypothetical protein